MHTILADGESVPFDVFMEWALYHPVTGYYRRPPEFIFGRSGDFFTASQLQPSFGALISAILPDGPVLELGAGGEEMHAALQPRPYRAIGPDDDLPSGWVGNIFANEFFDALPVTAGVRQGARLFELLVQKNGSTLRWIIGPELSAERRGYVETYYPALPDGAQFEISERAVQYIRRMSECLVSGTVLIVDYGWTGNEYLRFPHGSLMSYSHHLASPEVLANPGLQDITSHVPFPVLIQAARECGLTIAAFETLSQTLLTGIERAPSLLQDPSLKGQLKTLLFGMGENFRTLTLTRERLK